MTAEIKSVGTARLKRLSRDQKWEECTRFAATGSCIYGDGCRFAHGVEQLGVRACPVQHKQLPCHPFFTGPKGCPMGSRCTYLHDEVRLVIDASRACIVDFDGRPRFFETLADDGGSERQLKFVRKAISTDVAPPAASRLPNRATLRAESLWRLKGRPGGVAVPGMPLPAPAIANSPPSSKPDAPPITIAGPPSIPPVVSPPITVAASPSISNPDISTTAVEPGRRLPTPIRVDGGSNRHIAVVSVPAIAPDPSMPEDTAYVPSPTAVPNAGDGDAPASPRAVIVSLPSTLPRLRSTAATPVAVPDTLPLIRGVFVPSAAGDDGLIGSLPVAMPNPWRLAAPFPNAPVLLPDTWPRVASPAAGPSSAVLDDGSPIPSTGFNPHPSTGFDPFDGAFDRPAGPAAQVHVDAGEGWAGAVACSPPTQSDVDVVGEGWAGVARYEPAGFKGDSHADQSNRHRALFHVDGGVTPTTARDDSRDAEDGDENTPRLDVRFSTESGPGRGAASLSSEGVDDAWNDALMGFHYGDLDPDLSSGDRVAIDHDARVPGPSRQTWRGWPVRDPWAAQDGVSDDGWAVGAAIEEPESALVAVPAAASTMNSITSMPPWTDSARRRQYTASPLANVVHCATDCPPSDASPWTDSAHRQRRFTGPSARGGLWDSSTVADDAIQRSPADVSPLANLARPDCLTRYVADTSPCPAPTTLGRAVSQSPRPVRRRAVAVGAPLLHAVRNESGGRAASFLDATGASGRLTSLPSTATYPPNVGSDAVPQNMTREEVGLTSLLSPATYPPNAGSDAVQQNMTREEVDLSVAVRYEAVHCFGTWLTYKAGPDVLRAFERYSPLRVQWISDLRCNVLFASAHNARRALVGLSEALPAEWSSRVTDQIESLSVSRPDAECRLWRLGRASTSRATQYLRLATAADVPIPKSKRPPSDFVGRRYYDKGALSLTLSNRRQDVSVDKLAPRALPVTSLSWRAKSDTNTPATRHRVRLWTPCRRPRSSPPLRMTSPSSCHIDHAHQICWYFFLHCPTCAARQTLGGRGRMGQAIYTGRAGEEGGGSRPAQS